MLTTEMQTLITDHSAGMVASINDDGTPSVSPKATFFILDESTIAFANIRSPGTVSNIRKRPAVEVSFLDVLYRKSVRVTGNATYVRAGEEAPRLVEMFSAGWPNLVAIISGFVKIDISAAELIHSPAYDRGAKAEELREIFLTKLNAL